MDTLTFTVVMTAAVMHAGWNLAVKKDEDKFLALAMMAGTSGLGCLAVLFFLPALDRSAWPYLALSTPLHAGYRVFLGIGYRQGNLSHVYPVARGATPIFVTLFSLALLPVTFGSQHYLGIAAISLSLVALAWQGPLSAPGSGWAFGSAVIAALFVASFSIVDSVGVRASASPTTYIFWLFVLEGMAMLCAAWWRNGFRHALAYGRRNWKINYSSGAIMSLAHGLIIWAFSRADVALVAALRESSVVINMCLSAWILKEVITPLRILATLGVLSGMVLIAVA